MGGPLFSSSVEGVDVGKGYGVFGRSTRDWSPELRYASGVYGRSSGYYASGVYGLSTGQFGNGVRGSCDNGYGVAGYSKSWGGVYGRSEKNAGVIGSGDTSVGVGGLSIRNLGVYGRSNTGAGVAGESKTSYGVAGYSNTVGVYGRSYFYHAVFGTSTKGDGVVGVSRSNGRGVYGSSDNGDGVFGFSNKRYGVYGYSNFYPGVFGYSPNNTGVVGYSASGTGLYGSTDTGLAALLEGNVEITGNLSVGGILKSGGAFRIDHPLDPANKYLSHSFVESPDMKNVYDGMVTLDDKGKAEIELPDWFSALNKDFRYQLTAIGAPAPNLYIAEEISDDAATTSNYNNNKSRFKVAGGTSGMKVSWQVTGIRKDPWANAHRIPVEEDKPAKERGYYTYPELFMVSSQKREG